MDFLLVEHAIVAAVFIWLINKAFSLGFQGLKDALLVGVIRGLSVVPGVKGKIEQENQKIVEKIEVMVKNKELDELARERSLTFTRIPARGLDSDSLLSALRAMRGDNIEKAYAAGKGFGGIYIDLESHEETQHQVFGLFADSNALYPDLFPALRKFEAEVVRMACTMLAGDDQTCGTMTSGGTESILMAVKTYRESARKRNPGIKPQMIVPVSAHAAFAKAAHYFDVELVVVPVDDVTMEVDLAAVRKAVNPNVIMIVGSAPGYPHGVIDDIEELSKIALQHGVGLHVDGCLGGFLLPWLQKLGHISKKFDFSVPGVTSVSLDVHKYGYSAKGASIICYRNKELLLNQFFTYTEWSGGLYCSPSAAGSRPGGLIATAWASLVSLGEEGYLKAARNIQETFEVLVNGIKALPDVELVGAPEACAIAFGSSKLDIFKVADAMRNRGWNNIACMQKPVCLHIPVAMRESFNRDVFLADLRESVDEVREHPERFKDGMAPVYGMAATMPDRSLVLQLLTSYTEALLKV